MSGGCVNLGELAYDAGVLISDVKLRKADTPPEVIDDFRDVQAAGADREAKINEAQRYRAEVIPAARGQAAQIVQQAEAYKAEVVARSEGEASRFISTTMRMPWRSLSSRRSATPSTRFSRTSSAMRSTSAALFTW